MRDDLGYWDLERLEEVYRRLSPPLIGLGVVLTADGMSPLVAVLRLHPQVPVEDDHELKSQVGRFWEQLQPLDSLPPGFAEELSALVSPEAPPPVVLSVSDLEAAAVGAGDRTRCAATHARGTLGFPVARSGTRVVDGFLSAGHVFPLGLNSVAQLEIPQRFSSNSYSVLGTVVAHADPVNAGSPGGWDYALIGLDAGIVPPAALTSTVASLSTTLPQPLPVTMHGGISGVQSGGIVGVLMTLGVPSPPAPAAISRLWRDSWILIPSATAQQGDSGAAVLDAASYEAIGILVGGSRQLPATTYAVQYVQDLESLLQHELALASVSLV
jgi:hypothetical protein